MARQGASGTRTDEVHRRLRSDILAGRLVPGSRLKFPELCETYGVSVGAAREALTRLTAEGMVKTQPHQGYMVTPLSHEDLADLTRARIEIESLVLRLSVQEGDVQWESRAVAAHHVLERAVFLSDDDPDHPTDEWAAAHARFHLALLDGCTNRRLLDVARALREEAELYRQWSVSFGQEPDRDLAGEHRALLEASVGRQADLAGQLLRDHIAHTTSLLISVATDEPIRAAAPARADERAG
ncbi:GntR family transcriptional regulator [Pseudonocardia sp. WMMC193]|uniref:GntR family transcriptional regulator n=1 Tax=Pseudonocardia sp. WMMC193 TaxID=2911965 RepID=UPI001F48F3C5|nr:GntR family transcriptional regulator [Pseudonocardia sp. WMMC193]MCF7549958.1 GntR family transcriptional regulator [Pseudonocardia sp. WMMC193]